MARLYVWWILFLPCGIVALVVVIVCLWWFYWWALEPAEGESVQERIERLERELGIR